MAVLEGAAALEAGVPQPEVADAFEARAKVLAAQYFAFEPLPGMHVNGTLPLGENIADLGGVPLAHDAYRVSLNGQPAPVFDGFIGDQRVFVGWARAWRGKVTDGPPANIDAWYTAFDVEPGDSLYVAPEHRARIW